MDYVDTDVGYNLTEEGSYLIEEKLSMNLKTGYVEDMREVLRSALGGAEAPYKIGSCDVFYVIINW